MIIPFEKAFKLLSDCSAVIVDDNALVYPSLDHDAKEGEDEFLYLSYTDDEGETFTYHFNKEDNENVEVVGNSMFLKDTDGEEGEVTQLTLLIPQNLEEKA
jgi:hypothetical protein